jgi:hypothetical protein
MASAHPRVASRHQTPNLKPSPSLRSQAFCAKLARDVGLDLLVGPVGLRAGVGDSAVLAVLEDFKFAFPAGLPVCFGEFFLHGRAHVAVQLALQNVKRQQRHRLAAFEDLLRVSFEDRFPGIEINFVELDHFLPLSLLRVLKARVGIAHRRVRHDKGKRRVEVGRFGERQGRGEKGDILNLGLTFCFRPTRNTRG